MRFLESWPQYHIADIKDPFLNIERCELVKLPANSGRCFCGAGTSIVAANTLVLRTAENDDIGARVVVFVCRYQFAESDIIRVITGKKHVRRWARSKLEDVGHKRHFTSWAPEKRPPIRRTIAVRITYWHPDC